MPWDDSLDPQSPAYGIASATERFIRVVADDGGLSGGTMERPALQRLLADIAANLIDVVVVYKVDRLTRSLANFE